MSVKVMHWVWECSKTVGNDRLVLLAIADRASDEGLDAWPSIRTLARKTRLHERTVQRCIGNIENIGELKVQRKNGPSGTNIYAVRMDALVLQESSRSNRRKPPPPLAICHPQDDNLPPGGKLSPGGGAATGGVAPSPPGGGAIATGGVAPSPPNTSVTSSTSSTSKGKTALARAPNANGNYRIVERIAFELVARGSWVHEGTVYPITDEADLVEAVKWECARLAIDYGGHSDVATDVVHRACASEWFKHTHPGAVGRERQG